MVKPCVQFQLDLDREFDGCQEQLFFCVNLASQAQLEIT